MRTMASIRGGLQVSKDGYGSWIAWKLQLHGASLPAGLDAGLLLKNALDARDESKKVRRT